MTRAAALLAVAVLACTACTSATGVAGPPAVDARHLVYTRGGAANEAVWIGDVEGRRMRRLARGRYGLVSPDGTTIAVSRRAGVFLIGSDGRGGRLVARGRPAAWLPDSRHLLTVRAKALVNVDLEDGGAEVIERREVVSWSISPNGESIAYDVHRESRPRGECWFEIHTARLDGSSKRRLTTGWRSSNPVWGDDGIAYAYRPPGTGCFEPRIWRMDADGRNRAPLMKRLPRRLATSGYYGVRPYAWIRGRRALLATVPTEWGAVLALVDSRDGAVRVPDLDPRPRSSRHMYVDDASNDGRHVVGAACGAEGPCTIRTYSVIERRSRAIETGNVRYPDWNR